MADFNDSVIDEVTTALQRLLGRTLDPNGATGQIVIQALPVVGTTLPLNKLLLTLYDIHEDPYTRNRPDLRVVDPLTGREEIQRPPVGLLLHYMATSTHTDPASAMGHLAMIVRAFNDSAMLEGDEVSGSLNRLGVTVKLGMIQPSLNDKITLWQGYQQPYRVSLYWEARVVPLVVSKPVPTAPPVTVGTNRDGRGGR